MRNSQPNYIKQVSKENSMRNHFKKLQEPYNSDINLAIYMDLDGLQKQKVFEVISTNQSHNFVVNFYGFRMNLSEPQMEKLYKLFIREMDTMLRNQSNRKYSILLFCQPSGNINPFDQLKDLYKKLPAIYFVKLNKFYVIEPGFMVKSFSFLAFTSWSKLFQKHVQYVQSVQRVQQISDLKIYNILCKCPKQITKDIKILVCENPNTKKSSIKVQKPKPFDCLKRDFNQYEIDRTRNIPMILSILIETMKQDQDSCKKEGIFRCAGSIQDEQEITKYVIQVKTFKILDIQNFCKKSIAGVIKKIFTSSTNPLIPYQVYDRILHDTIQEEKIIEYWRQILNQLPTLNRRILCYTIQFLRKYILENNEVNKMNAHNISVVFTPCFFRSKQCCLSDLINSGKFAALFKNLLEKYDLIFQNFTTDQQKCSQQIEKDMKGINSPRFYSKVTRSGMRRQLNGFNQ